MICKVTRRTLPRSISFAVAVFAFLYLGLQSDADPVRFSIGNPTNEEQAFIELINRLRAAPAEEAIRLAETDDPEIRSSYVQFGVDLDAMKSALAESASAQPLVPNEKLTAAARIHSFDMLENDFQAHTGSDGSNGGKRISREGFRWSKWGENVFAYSNSVIYGHAGFTVDWGYGPGGMQHPALHRKNLLQSEFKEIGVGHLIASNATVGPEIVTQNFGVGPDSLTCITGVVYYDVNSNGEYDAGEGIGGARVGVDECRFCAVTADAGGYAIPVDGNGSYSISLTLPGREVTEKTITVAGDQNAKLDFALPYESIAIDGTNTAMIGAANAYGISSVPGAKSYDLRISELRDNLHVSGQVHLTFPSWEDRVFEIDRSIRPSGTSELQFAVMYRWATSSSRLYAQISADDGTTWETVWSRPGTDASGDSRFAGVKVPLSDYAGTSTRVRFLFRHHNKAFLGTDTNLGVYVNAVHITNSQEFIASSVTQLPGNAKGFSLDPHEESSYLLEIRPRIPSPLPYREGRLVSALNVGNITSNPASNTQRRSTVLLSIDAAPSLNVSKMRRLSDERVWIEFEAVGDRFDRIYVERSTSLSGEWSEIEEATLLNFGNGQYRMETTYSEENRIEYFRLQGVLN